MIKIACSLIILIGIFNAQVSVGQEKISLFLGQYLVTTGELDSTLYQVKKVKGNVGLITNYYALKVDTFKLGVDKFVFCRFGAYSEHSRAHLGILKMNDFSVNCIINCSDIELDLQKIFLFLDSYSKSYETRFELVKTGIVKRIIKEYPDYPYWRRF